MTHVEFVESAARCEPQPLNIPGAVQQHGALIAVDPGTWKVTHASANLDRFLGTSATEALGLPLTTLLGEELTALLQDAAGAKRLKPGNAGFDAGLAGGRIRLLPFVSSGGEICIDLLLDQQSDSAEPALMQAQRVIQSLRMSRTSLGLCRIAVNDIRRITGFDRVMVYCFDQDGSGDVVAENHAAGVSSFLGLKYPAGDIPPQARRLYMLQRMRVIPDVSSEPVELLATRGRHANDLDLSASSIRAVSPCHLQYVRHMGVAATAVISLIVEGRLWGMLVCHHNTPWTISADQRALLDLIGQVMSVMLGSINETEITAGRLERQRALGGIAAAIVKPDDSIADAFAACASDLVNLVPAHGALVTVGDRVVAVGRSPEPGALGIIMDALRAFGSDDLVATPSLTNYLTEERASSLDGFAGALLLPLPNCSNGSIAWFRRELDLTVNWAGNPTQSPPDPATGIQKPRESFELWREAVRGRSAPWTEGDLDAARDLRRIVDEALVRRNEGELLVRLRDNDPLTGLPNRRAVERHLKAIGTLTRQPPTALVVVNVDRFRKVNELLGHDAGDALLAQIAHRLQVVSAPRDMVARLGTDEFGVLGNTDSAGEFAAKIASVFVQPFEIARQVLQVNASVGVADNLAATSDVLGLMRSAEAAMRQSKLSGGGRVSIFEQTLRDEASRQLVIEQKLDSALRSERNQFQLAFQPIVDVKTGALRSWEVLIRWHHPTLGNVPPGVFIPIAESSGLISAVGDLVLDLALRHLVDAPPSEEADEQDVYLSINVSPLQLTRPGFAADIAEMLNARGIVPSRVCVEVTEGVFTDRTAVMAIADIRRLGVLVAVDDFGIGYSSLSSLQRLPADIVKLDRSFLPEQAAPSEADRSFLGAVVMLAHTAGLKVIVEGVETQVQLKAVVAAGADAIQGYYMAKPMPSEVAMALACERQSERSWVPKLLEARVSPPVLNSSVSEVVPGFRTGG